MTGWVNTRPLRVELVLTGHRIVTGDIHLQPLAEHHTGPETAVDLFNRNEPFFVIMQDGDRPLFIAKAQVVFVKLLPPPRPAMDDPVRDSAATRVELEIELVDGTHLEGIVTLEVPPARARVIDFLNSAPSFFGLWTPEALRIINRHYVRAVSPLVDLSRASS